MPPVKNVIVLDIQNYRSLGDVDLKLGRLTVLVGPNGSGKSNLVDVLRLRKAWISCKIVASIRNIEVQEIVRNQPVSGIGVW